MRILLAVGALSVVTACSSADAPQQALMAKIESAIILPSGAPPLAEYARYYAQDEDGIVWGSYTPEYDQQFVDSTADACSRLKGEGGFAARQPHFPCPLDDGPVRWIKAGQRLWLPSWKELPGAAGGGCGFVSFRYDPARNRFSDLECNGPY